MHWSVASPSQYSIQQAWWLVTEPPNVFFLVATAGQVLTQSSLQSNPYTESDIYHACGRHLRLLAVRPRKLTI